MIEEIAWKNDIIAIILRESFDREGVNFVTPEDSTLQLGVLRHLAGHKIKPHVHMPCVKVINVIQEVLHIQSGRVRVDFYDGNGKAIRNAVLNRGDTILLMSQGHGIEVLEDSKMIEIKQGPYEGVKEDKKRFEGYC